MSLEQDKSLTHPYHDVGQTLQVVVPSAQLGLASTITGNGSITSNTIANNGYKCFAFGVKSTQAGSISIQRYIDLAGTIPVGAAITATLTANTAQYASSTDAVPYQSFIITISNSSGSSATLSNEMLLLQSQ